MGSLILPRIWFKNLFQGHTYEKGEWLLYTVFSKIGKKKKVCWLTMVIMMVVVVVVGGGGGGGGWQWTNVWLQEQALNSNSLFQENNNEQMYT